MVRNRDVGYSAMSEIDARQDPLFLQQVGSGWLEQLDRLRCPQCLGQVICSGAQTVLSCTECGRDWTVVGGVPILADSGQHYHAQVPEPLMRSLLADMPRLGWRQAFYRTLGSLPAAQSDALCRDVLEPNRPLGLSLLTLQPNASILDLGAGWGALSIPLAEAGVSVTAVDLAPMRARFTQLRAHEEGLTNLCVLVGGDTPFLPLAESQFDAVILNGVLEWVGVNEEGKPRDIQVEYLREVRRVLKPGGVLFLGIENRVSLQYLLGAPEDHVELPYVALMPRRLADWWVNTRIGTPYRTHTYSIFGYRGLIQDAGFRGIHFFYPYPNYRRPTKIIPLDSRLALGYWQQVAHRSGMRRKIAVLGAWMGFLKPLANSYIILAHKPES